MRFFHLNFLKVRCILAQKIYNAHVKDGGQSQQPGIIGQLVTGEPQRIGISHLKEQKNYSKEKSTSKNIYECFIKWHFEKFINIINGGYEMIWKLSACIKHKFCFEDSTKLLAFFVKVKEFTKESKD